MVWQSDFHQAAHPSFSRLAAFIALVIIFFGGRAAFAQTLTPAYTLFLVHTNAAAQVTIEKNDKSATAHTAENDIAILKVDNPLIDMSGQKARVGSPYPNPCYTDRIAVDFSLPAAQRVKIALFDILGKPIAPRWNEQSPRPGFTAWT